MGIVVKNKNIIVDASIVQESVFGVSTWINIAKVNDLVITTGYTNANSSIWTFSVGMGGVLTYKDSYRPGLSGDNINGLGYDASNGLLFVGNFTRGRFYSVSVDSVGNLSYNTFVSVSVPISAYCDGSYAYVGTGQGLIGSYSYDAGGLLTLVDSSVGPSSTYYYNNIEGDGNFLYVACASVGYVNQKTGIKVMSVDSGVMTCVFEDNMPSDVQRLHKLVGEDYLYAACGVDGIYVYKVGGDGSLEYVIDYSNESLCSDVYGDSNFLYSVDSTGYRIRLYAKNGDGTLTLLSDNFQSSVGMREVAGDDNFVYVASTYGIRTFSVGDIVNDNISIFLRRVDNGMFMVR